jgi:hypothetical protein
MQLPNRIRTSKSKAVLGFSSLLREKGRDMLVFAFFLVVSTGFWVLQKLDDTFEADIRVPLELVGIPKGTIITTPLPKEVVFTVQDRGTNLLNYNQHSKGIQPIRLDFSLYDNGSVAGKVSVSATDVQRAFQQQMSSSTQVVRLTPSKYEFHYNRGVSRRIPVKVRGGFSTVQQNYLQGISIAPDSVTVYAPQTILDTLRYAYTEPCEVEGLSKTSTFTLSFPRIPGVKTVPETVQVTAHLDYYTEQTVQVPVRGLNFPAGVVLKTFPSQVTIKYRVGAANARSVHPDDFLLAATYEELLANGNQKYRLQLKTVPTGVSNVRIYPPAVDYLLEQDLETPVQSKEDGR